MDRPLHRSDCVPLTRLGPPRCAWWAAALGAGLGFGLGVACLLLGEEALGPRGPLDLLGLRNEPLLYVLGLGPMLGAGLAWHWSRDGRGLGAALGAGLGWAAALSLGFAFRLGAGFSHLAPHVGALLLVSAGAAVLAAGLGGCAEEALVRAQRRSL